MDDHNAGRADRGPRAITYWAWRLDRLFNRRLGAPYRVVLAVGLAASIAASWRTLVTSFQSTTNILLILATVAFQSALLINQLAQAHQRRRARLRRKALSAPK